MNKDRRKLIADAMELVTQARVMIEQARDEERDYYDNMPESFQGGEKGEKAEAAADALDEAVTSLEEVEDKCNEATEG